MILNTGCAFCMGPSALREANGHDPGCIARARPVTETAPDSDEALAQMLQLVDNRWTTTDQD